jgi:integrase
MLAYKIWFAQQNELVKGSVLTAPTTSLASAWEAHAATERYRLLAQSSKDKRRQRWDAFLAWATDHRIRNVDDIDVATALRYLSEHSNKAKTYNNIRSDLAAVLPVFSETEQRSTKRGESKSDVVRQLDESEIEAILDYLDDPACRMDHAGEWRMAVIIGLRTGLRFKDVALLRWESIQNGMLEIVPEKTARLGKAVIMRIPPKLLAMLSSMPRETEFVLPGLAESYNEDGSTRYFVRMLRRIGIKSDSRGRAGFHSLRVVFATKARSAGIDADLLGGILGHGSTGQTEHYNRSSATVDLSVIEET